MIQRLVNNVNANSEQTNTHRPASCFALTQHLNYSVRRLAPGGRPSGRSSVDGRLMESYCVAVSCGGRGEAHKGRKVKVSGTE